MSLAEIAVAPRLELHRSSRHAPAELVFMRDELVKIAPTVFADFAEDSNG